VGKTSRNIFHAIPKPLSINDNPLPRMRRYGLLNVLKWAMEMGHTLNLTTNACKMAAAKWTFTCIEWLVEKILPQK